MFTSIKSQLMVIVSILVLGSSVISGIINTHFVASDVEAHIKSNNLMFAQAMAQNVQAFVQDAYNITQTLAENSEVRKMNPEKLKLLLAGNAARFAFFNNLYVTRTADGMLVARAYGEPGSRRYRSWYLEMMKNNTPRMFSTYTMSENKAVSSIYFPVFDKNNNYVAIMGADVKLNYIQNLVENFHMGPGSYAYIIDSEGVVLAHPDGGQSRAMYNYKTLTKTVVARDAQGQAILEKAGGDQKLSTAKITIPPELHKITVKALAGEYGVTEYQDLNGNAVISAYCPIQLPGISKKWAVVTVQNKNAALAAVNDVTRKNTLVAVGIIVLALFIITLFISRKVTKPIVELIAGTDEIAKGNLAKRLKINTDNEIGKLARAFNTMAENLADKVVERDAAQEALKRANDDLDNKVKVRTQELTQVFEDLKTMQAFLIQSEKMAALGNLVAGVAHEINTPIGSGITAASYLQQVTAAFSQGFTEGRLRKQDLEDYLEDIQESSAIILRNLERAGELIKSFKQVSVDQSSEVRREFQVKKYLEEVLLSMQPYLKRTKHHIILQCEEGLQIDSFPGAFSQIITNLLMNSLVHAYEPQDEGYISIAIRQEEQKLLIRYADDGKGMEEGVRLKIFDPFFTTKRGVGGTGLGLHIVYNIVTRQFGGAITCDSEPGHGTIFDISIPL